MMWILRLCGIAILTAVTALLLKPMRSPLVPIVVSVGIILLLSLSLERYREAIVFLTDTLSEGTTAPYGTLMLKSLGIGLVVRLTGDICRDSGEEALASGVEMAGKIEILLLCLPLLQELLTLLKGVIL